MYDPELLARVKDAHTRTLVLWGEDDPIVTTSFGFGYADAFSDARFETIAGAGHLAAREAPHTTFTAIDRFLAG